MQQEFNSAQPDQLWVADITYIRTDEGWLYLIYVIDLYSRTVVGWSMNFTLATVLVLDALMIAVWRMRPKTPVMIHLNKAVSLAVMTLITGARTTNSCPA
ncbi:MAG: DDE-type integrase/transposase/recombinase [Candidatus Saccharibacteria bacterium]|nr:DDE-type integrase/transposase/recombinase [Rhodoferax sp.]